MADLAQYDKFASQFANSLVQESTTGNGNWFGRLVKFRQGEEFQFINFFGTSYSESVFRRALENNTIVIKKFDVSNINYVPEASDPLYATVTADVYIEATIDAEQKSGNFTIMHKIKQTWQSYETELLPV